MAKLPFPAAVLLAVILAGGAYSCAAVGLASIYNTHWITAEVRAPDFTLQRVLHVNPYKLCVTENGTETCQTCTCVPACSSSSER